MRLASGVTLGSYQIIGLLGAGGMGEVYRARDARLNRDVAIKVLPDAFALDRDRFARFEREAQALAALNHPNIAQVYAVIETPPALVMELVEGEDLAQRIARGPIPIDDAIPIARQIADALEAAHERGIIHRDLKPANVKLAPDGTVKVLDFGLAKSLGAGGTGSGSDVSDAPTLTSPLVLTQASVILGTAAYMAPEQARGRPVDRRADIWAFGCVLYEMLTGARPFSGDDLTETLAAIVRDAPDLARLPAATPPAIRTLIERCLEKDPRERLRDIGEARVALSRPQASPPAPVRARVARRRSFAAAGWMAAGLAIGGGLVLLLAPHRAPGPPIVTSLRQLTEMPGPEINPDISPNGRQVLYAAGPAGSRDLYLLRVGGGHAIDLTSSFDGDDVEGAFSPDGEQIAFRSDRDGGGIFVMGATGESVRRLTSSGYDPRWSPDGKHIAYATEGVDDPYSRLTRSELWTADVESGAATRLLEGDAVQPSWSPQGGRIAFWANTGGQRDIWTVAASGGKGVAVTSDPATDWAPEWSPDGRFLYFISDRGGSPNLWRVAIDESTGLTSGQPEAVTNGVRALASARFARDATHVVLGVTDRAFDVSLSAFDPAHPDVAGAARTIRSASLGWCSPSRTAEWLACSSRTGQEDIVLMRADGSETRRLTDDAVKDRIPVWSPDDKTLAFMSTRTGRWELWAINADGSGLRQLTDLKSDVVWGVWSPDGKRMVFGASSFGPYGLWFFDPSHTATRDTARFIENERPLLVDTWSSDGLLIAGTRSNGAGLPEAIAVWNADGRLLRQIPMPLINTSTFNASFVAGTHDLIANTAQGITLLDADTGQWHVIRKISPPLSSRMSGDGHTLYVERPTIEGDLWLMQFAGESR
jgi:serine/threonine protein kinase/Tol biopolymer transport system component